MRASSDNLDHLQHGEKAAEKKSAGDGVSLRRKMAWLHTWGGISACWMLYVIFISGTLSVFDEAITRWMKPELTSVRPLSVAERSAAVKAGQNHLQQMAPQAGFWAILLPDENDPALRLYWEDQRPGMPRSGRATLDAQTGLPTQDIIVRETDGGHHFVHLHSSLHSGRAGEFIVGFFAMAMLVALMSGIIIHKRIFMDFFTFRPGKGQRSWLDAHNAAAVLTLPFQVMIVYTGLVVFYWIYMPFGIAAHYQKTDEFFAELMDRPVQRQVVGVARPLLPLAQLMDAAQARLGVDVSVVTVERPGDSSAVAKLLGPLEDAPSDIRIRPDAGGHVLFAAVSGDILKIQMPGVPRDGVGISTQQTMASLHKATFGGQIVKCLYFIFGMAGAAMIAAGALLFMTKRRDKASSEFGAQTLRIHRLIDVLNLSVLVGLPIASVGYLWINRLLPVGIGHRAGWEIALFFVLWSVAALHAAVRPRTRAWREQMMALSFLCLALPLCNWLLNGEQFVGYLLAKEWGRAGVELAAVAFGLLTAMGLGAVRKKR